MSLIQQWQIHSERRTCRLCGRDMGIMSDGAYEAEGGHCLFCYCDECPAAHT